MSPPIERHFVECGQANTASASDWCPSCRRRGRNDMILLATWWMAPAMLGAGILLASAFASPWPAWVGVFAALAWFVTNRKPA